MVTPVSEPITTHRLYLLSLAQKLHLLTENTKKIKPVFRLVYHRQPSNKFCTSVVLPCFGPIGMLGNSTISTAWSSSIFNSQLSQPPTHTDKFLCLLDFLEVKTCRKCRSRCEIPSTERQKNSFIQWPAIFRYMVFQRFNQREFTSLFWLLSEDSRNPSFQLYDASLWASTAVENGSKNTIFIELQLS